MPWYDDLFDERYLAFYEELFDTSVADRDAEFVERALSIAPPARVLELGCGFGRHAVALAKRGYHVTGTDLSPAMLAIAQKLAADAGVDVRWERRDMRELAGLGPFDACTCLYTVLGYFDDDQNESVLRAVHGLLAPGARLMLDVTNPLPQLHRWPGESWKEISTGVRREASRYDPLTGRLTTERVLYRADGGKLTMPPSVVRMYAPHELRAMLLRSGFEVEQLFGGMRDEPFDWKRSPRQVWVARR